MPLYLTQDTLACLTRQGAEALAQRMQSGGFANERVLVIRLEGQNVRAELREALESR